MIVLQQVVTISEFPEYWNVLSSKLPVAWTTESYAKMRFYCLKCGSEISKDALVHLAKFGQARPYNGQVMITRTMKQATSSQRNDFQNLRSGKCPVCDNTKMLFVVGNDPGDLYRINIPSKDKNADKNYKLSP